MNYSYDDYLAREKQNNNNQGQNRDYSEGPNITYLSTLLKNDGNSAIIRFPYTSPNEFDLCQFHEVTVEGSKYPRKVECTCPSNMDEENNCVLCKSKAPLNKRFFMKMVVYINGVATPAVFDRPEWFSKQVAEKIQDYGDLSKHIFKIIRDGAANSTKTNYRIEGPLNLLKPQMYNDDLYNPDISIIKDLTPHMMFVKSQSKFLEENQGNYKNEAQEDQKFKEENGIADLDNQTLPGLEDNNQQTQQQNTGYDYSYRKTQQNNQQPQQNNNQDNSQKPKRTYNYNNL